MTGFAFRIQPHWPWLALGVSLAMLAAAHAFERFGGLNPCALCLTQREVYWGAAGVAAAGLIVLRLWPRLTLRRAFAALLGLAFLTGALVAAYHVAVENHWVVARCELGDVGDIVAFNPNGTFQVPNCDAVQWSLLGISMAGYNALISLFLAAASFVIAFAPAPPVDEDA